MNKEQMRDSLKENFERWYAEALSKFPDIAPYREILFIAFVSGAVYATEIHTRQLEEVFGKPN